MNQIKKIFKFQLFSDIHIEFSNGFPKIPPLTNYLFLAGDIGKLSGTNFKPFFDYCSENWKKTFYILGNHEYYSSNKTLEKLNGEYKAFFNTYSNVFLLDDSYYDIDDDTGSYRIYGSTLWSLVDSTDGLNDFNMIQMKNEKNWTVPINLDYYNNLYKKSAKKLFDQIKIGNWEGELEPKELIVMTHFPPIRKTDAQPNLTSHPHYQNEKESRKKYFANNFTDEYLKEWDITEKDLYSNIKVWISGHTHYSYDFNYRTRFIANQLGYQSQFNHTGINLEGIYELTE